MKMTWPNIIAGIFLLLLVGEVIYIVVSIKLNRPIKKKRK